MVMQGCVFAFLREPPFICGAGIIQAFALGCNDTQETGIARRTVKLTSCAFAIKDGVRYLTKFHKFM